jgi:hypothetical protein
LKVCGDIPGTKTLEHVVPRDLRGPARALWVVILVVGGGALATAWWVI